ncbi:MAG: GalNAc(5)-diNAcBac-PP-undecaprenol beta-1,3-glucosyltransferase [Firmicutes bacterium ADurb.Bin153]|nr:MAG: GalNAc(5)-diNAcBac-PP-undecaprenol beta-1,3-glucosyltransferase [Firmicutes bacterium ADurb.Bin153]
MQINDILMYIMEVAAGAFSIFLGILVLVLLSNIILIPCLRNSLVTESTRKLSILVPARNEQDNIEKCVRSLMGQDYPNYEIVVLNDNSTDATGEILERLRLEDPRIRIIDGTPLPQGWLGKNWACMQLAEAATGEILFFTDADTEHEPFSASASVALMEDRNPGMMSGFVKQRMDTLGEKLVVPLMLWGMLCFTPVIVMHYMKYSFLTAACGQYMVFDRKAYFKVGGHSSVKARVDEDKEFARVMKQNGFPVIMADATRMISCKMYGGFKEAVRGFSKNVFSAFNYRVLPFVLVWLAAVTCIVTPVLYLILVDYYANPALANQAMILVVLSLAIWFLTYWKTRVPYYLTLVYPMSMFIWFYVSMNSVYLSITGKSFWKGRNIPKPKIKLM